MSQGSHNTGGGGRRGAHLRSRSFPVDSDTGWGVFNTGSALHLLEETVVSPRVVEGGHVVHVAMDHDPAMSENGYSGTLAQTGTQMGLCTCDCSDARQEGW